MTGGRQSVRKLTPRVSGAGTPRTPVSGWKLSLLAVSAFLAACARTTGTAPPPLPPGEQGQIVPVEGGGQYVDIAPDELRTVLQAEDVFFVNVHVPYEGEIEGTDAFIPYDEVSARLAEFPSDKEARVVLYCRSGSMSAIAARSLVSTGYTQVYNLDGGFRAWAALGYELIDTR